MRLLHTRPTLQTALLLQAHARVRGEEDGPKGGCPVSKVGGRIIVIRERRSKGMSLLLLFLQESPAAVSTPVPLRTQAQGSQLLPALEVDGHPKADPLPGDICPKSPHRTERDENEEGEERRVEEKVL